MKKGKYLLPNLFTSGNLVCGFVSMIYAHNGDYPLAALVILLAAGLDCLDGKVARLTGSASAFGVEYDSLADLLSFGMAPGWLLYTWALRSLSPFGWLAAFAFVICGALRLARFNVQATGVQKYTFTGLPIPAAASVVASAVLVLHQLYEDVPSSIDTEHPFILVFAAYTLALLMVSNFKYRSFKRLRWRRMWPLPLLAGIALLITVLVCGPALTLFLLCIGYALSGPLETLLWRKKPKENVIPAEQ
ncbi:MAG: CDP-diacylglycerol--serine O-phosphatidyltransferase [Candidatus Tectomicrobia bacterium]|uniref:CDP-diacylglycerol--serine O-phosphatidyltransferase n=1 Tax=Tectimicrobiota bacterium TaxID=2528274 RepID=A0A938B2B3_UNCTE|nr:CDP-diacylglycerol--serine O-phosphatidyltransferase [Candidatus Tectomicrobia bacterium]